MKNLNRKIYYFLYVFFNVWFYFKWKFYQTFEVIDYVTFFSGFLVIYFLCEVVNNFTNSKVIRSLISSLLLAIVYIFGKYFVRVKTNFDYVVIIDNFREIFNKETLGVVSGTMKKKDFIETALVFIISLISILKFQKFQKATFKKYAIHTIVTIFLIIVLPFQKEGFLYFAKSIYDFHFVGLPRGEVYKKLQSERASSIKQNLNESDVLKKNVIIVNIESFNGMHINEKVTPVLHSLIPEGLFIEDFYGNSVQTIKGQFGFLCSQIPLLYGKASYKINGKNLNCMPKVFKNNGYQTYFHKAFRNMNFDNTYNFMKDIGFDLVKTTDLEKFDTNEVTTKTWGWGIQDDLSYIDYVDTIKEMSKKGPVFAMIHTVSHHMKFDHVPDRLQTLYPKTSDRQEVFLNSQHTTDGFLKTLIEKLKEENLYDNSVIIITGDHSYPAGEHGLFDNQTSYYQEFFKTPMLIIAKNTLEPKIIKKRTFSHIDIYPTLVELLNLKGEMNYVGKSILSSDSNYAPLIQPYNGQYIAIAHYPFKYVWGKRNNEEFYFDLEKDPMEEKKLYDEAILKDFRNKRDEIIYYLHQ